MDPPWLRTLTSALASPPHASVELDEAKLPSSLHAYQRAAVEFILQRGGRGLLAHEMGLGKTPMALGVVAHFSAEFPVLIVAPTVLLGQWASEICHWMPGVSKKHDVQMIKTGKDAISPGAKFELCSYGLLAGQRRGGEQTNAHLRATASGVPFKVIVCDEAHALKSMDSLRTLALLPMLSTARRVVLMTGTPLSNSCASDVYPLLSGVSGQSGAMPSLSAWNRHFCEESRKIHTGGNRFVERWVGVSQEHAAALHELLSNVMIRKRKEEVRDRSRHARSTRPTNFFISHGSPARAFSFAGAA